MEIIEPFSSQFDTEALEKFDRDPSIIYGLTGALTLGLLNDAWFSTARAHNAPDDFFERFSLGGSYLDGISEPLKPFFEGHIRDSITEGQVWTFEYQCPTPGRFRMFRMQVLPFGPSGDVDKQGCLITNASIVEIPRPEDDLVGAEDILSTYQRTDGLVTQCAHCRRTRRVDEPSRWDWVPQLVWERPESVSHGICAPCYEYFHNQMNAEIP